jgi:hypothetical protein
MRVWDAGLATRSLAPRPISRRAQTLFMTGGWQFEVDLHDVKISVNFLFLRASHSL